MLGDEERRLLTVGRAADRARARRARARALAPNVAPRNRSSA